LRNVFDQYSQPENRVTHAFMTAINEDRHLLGLFLRELVKVKPPVDPRKLSVLEQQYPGEDELSEDEIERQGIPDGWIFDDQGWCVFIETKVLAKLGADQINRHRGTARRRGFNNVVAVAIAPLPLLPTSVPVDTVLLEWRDVYAWLRKHSAGSAWAARAAEYLEIAEARLIDTKQFVEGTLTRFSGFHFGTDHPFTYLEGKRVLELALGELRGRHDLVKGLGMNPKAPGRAAITGRHGQGVWDFLSLASGSGETSFTKHPHLTLNVSSQAVEAMVTVPHGVNNVMRRNIVSLGEDGFRDVAANIVKGLKPLLHDHKGAAPWFRGLQRRYPSQRAAPFIDATIDFDLRTAVPSDPGFPKTQPQWLSAAYGSFVQKEGSNYQIQMGVVFRYERCRELQETGAIDLLASSWLGCRPLIDLARPAV
jgi:hypothetical protein